MTMPTKGSFTGWHMTLILVGFFGVVIAVNFFMARIAVDSFGGTVVDNSYVASQNYNRWLAAAEKQERLGWTVEALLTPDRFVVVAVGQNGRPLTGLKATGDALHPLGRSQDFRLDFAAAPDGRLKSTQPLPNGRWTVRIAVRRGADIYRLVGDY